MLRNLCRHAIDQIEYTGRQAGLDQHFDKTGQGDRRFFRAFDEDGAARCQRGRNLAHGLVDGKVPRREGRHRAYRLVLHVLAQIRRARRDHAAVDAARFFGKPFQHFAGAGELDARLHQALALLVHQHLRNLFGPLAHQSGSLAQVGRALHDRGFAPGGKAVFGRGQGLVQISHTGFGYAADHAFVGRVDDVEPGAALGVAPGAVDQQLDLVVHRRILSLSVLHQCCKMARPVTLPARSSSSTFCTSLSLRELSGSAGSTPFCARATSSRSSASEPT